MSKHEASDQLAAQRFKEFQGVVQREVEAIQEKYGDRRDAVEKAIVAKGYEPEELGWVVGSSGMTGVPGTPGSPERVFEDHREVLEAVVSELGIDLEKGAG